MKQHAKIRVDNKEYTVNPYMAGYGFDLFEEFVTVFGPGIAKILGTQKSLGSMAISDVDLSKLGDGLADILTQVKTQPGFLQSFMRKVLVQTFDGPKCVAEDFDTRFAGAYMHGIKLTAMTLKEQYSDFFAGIGARAGSGLKAT